MYAVIETAAKQNCGFFYFFFPVNAPRISATSNASVTLGSPIWLRCEAIYPNIPSLKSPKPFWNFNNTSLAEESQRYQSKDDGPRMGPNSTTKRLSLRLHIFNVSAQDVGWYTCGAKFKFDVVTANVFLSLKEEIPRGKVDDKESFSFVEIGFSPVQKELDVIVSFKFVQVVKH